MKRLIFIFLFLISMLFAESLKDLKEQGKKGDVDSLMKLALMYESGQGVKQDLNIAKRYYLQAKELGNQDAIIALSLLDLSNSSQKITHISNSVKVKVKSELNYEIEIDDLREIIKKAKNNDSEALYTLATLYDNGYGDIKADSKRALLLYIKSAKLGNKKAKEVLALKRDRLKK